MPESELRLIKRWEQYLPVKEINSLPRGLRGFYVLYKYSRKTDSYNVVYVGMSSSGSNKGHIRGRLKTHRRKKEGLWSHFSIFNAACPHSLLAPRKAALPPRVSTPCEKSVLTGLFFMTHIFQISLYLLILF